MNIIKADWIGFTGSIIGGVLTLLGVVLTIWYYKKQEKDNDEKEMKKFLCAIYWHLKQQIGKINELNTYLNKLGNNEIPKREIILDVDYEFYLNTILPHINRIFDHSEINRLCFFYDSLISLEKSRINYFHEQSITGQRYNINPLDKFKLLVAQMYSMTNGEGNYMGLIPQPCNAKQLLEKIRHEAGLGKEENTERNNDESFVPIMEDEMQNLDLFKS